MKIDRRQFITSAAAGFATAGLAGRLAGATERPLNPSSGPYRPPPLHPFLTPAAEFTDVSRGKPNAKTLSGEALVQVRLTPETWRLEVTADDEPKEYSKDVASITRPVTLDLAALHELAKKHGVKYIKAMQCLTLPTPLGQGLWEGVPLREVLRLTGTMLNVRRIYYWGFHNHDPKQMFRSSLSYSQAMETPPGELPVFLAYRLNGQPLPQLRGGPVRMIVPWAHGFKSIKWLQRIVLTNDYKANDTYADEKNNDPESHLKTAAYVYDLPEQFPVGQPITVPGRVISGWSGLARVEYWLRSVAGPADDLSDDDPAWKTAKWLKCDLAAPSADWAGILPAGVSSKDVLGFDRQTGRPLTWPLRYSMIPWSATLANLSPGVYEVRARAVDLNGFAQPEPRPMLKTGRNALRVRRFRVA